jgi:hypothetical protein
MERYGDPRYRHGDHDVSDDRDYDDSMRSDGRYSRHGHV